MADVVTVSIFRQAPADDQACLECHGTRVMFEEHGARADSLVVTGSVPIHLGPNPGSSVVTERNMDRPILCRAQTTTRQKVSGLE